MPIVRRLAALALNVLLLAAAFAIFKHPYATAYGNADAFVYGRGNAPADVREAVVGQLEAFGDGYRRRDLRAVDAFSAGLLADEAMALGTLPREVYVGRKAVTELVRTDWESWGDCTFFHRTAHVSSRGDTAWFAMIGFVKFDLSRFLVLPLRVSGILVQDGGAWKFSQLQFQFDLDFSLLLLVDVILLAWLAFNTGGLVMALFRQRRAGPARL